MNIQNPTDDEEFLQESSIAVNGDSDYTSDVLVVKLKRYLGGPNVDTASAPVDEEGGWYCSDFEPPTEGWDLGYYYIVVYRGQDEKAYVRIKVVDPE